jgi:hypothetical protein
VRHVQNPNSVQGFPHVYLSSEVKTGWSKREFYAQFECFENIGYDGKNRLATRPSIIVEIEYMDTDTPDNDALHDDAFKRIVAEAIADGKFRIGLALQMMIVVEQLRGVALDALR